MPYVGQTPWIRFDDPMASSLLAPNRRRYVVEPGALDDRAGLAFTNGHCHSLALALHRQTGGEIVGFTKSQRPFDHLLVRADDGRLIDIGGPRTPAEVVADGGCLRGVDTATLERLPIEYGWVPPDVDLASAWVPPLLERVVAGESHRRTGCFTSGFMLDPLRAIHVEWSEREGAVLLIAFGRLEGQAPTAWLRCMSARIPENSDGERVIDFAPAAFERHAVDFEHTIRSNRAIATANLSAPASEESPLCPPDEDRAQATSGRRDRQD